MKRLLLLCLLTVPLSGITNFSYKVKHITSNTSDGLTNKVNSFIKDNFFKGTKTKLIDIKYGESTKESFGGFWIQSYSVLIQYEEWK